MKLACVCPSWYTCRMSVSVFACSFPCLDVICEVWPKMFLLPGSPSSPRLLVFFSRNCHDLGFCAQAASASLYFYFPASPGVAVFVLMWMETAESSSAVAWFLFWKICYANLDRAAPLNGNRYFFLIYCPCVCSCLSMLRSVLSVGMPLNYQDSWVLQEQWNLVVFSFCAPVCYQLFIKSDGCESREALYRFFFFL